MRIPAWMLESLASRPSCDAWKKYVPWLMEACCEGAPPKTLGFQVSLEGGRKEGVSWEFGRGGEKGVDIWE